MSLTDLLRALREKVGTPKATPAEQVLPRLRDSARLRAMGGGTTASSLGEVTPFANEIQAPPAEAIPPPAWNEVFPGHHKALVADLARRGESIANWEVQDGRDLGVSESGHTVAFTLHKSGTSATIQVELTLFKGQLAHVRVR